MPVSSFGMPVWQWSKIHTEDVMAGAKWGRIVLSSENCCWELLWLHSLKTPRFKCDGRGAEQELLWDCEAAERASRVLAR